MCCAPPAVRSTPVSPSIASAASATGSCPKAGCGTCWPPSTTALARILQQQSPQRGATGKAGRGHLQPHLHRRLPRLPRARRPFAGAGDRTGSSSIGDEPLRLRVFVDKSVVEVFVNGKQCVATRVYPEREDSVGVSLRSQGQDARVVSLEAWQMENIYE